MPEIPRAKLDPDFHPSLYEVDTTENKTVHFVCDMDSELEDGYSDTSITCLPDGSWSQVLFYCKGLYSKQQL